MNLALLRRGAVPAGLFFAGGSLLASIGPLLPTLAERSGRPVSELGILFTVLSLGTMLGSSLFGGLMARWGVGRTLAIGSSLHALAMLLLSVAVPWWLQIVAIALAGLGYSAIMAGANVAVVLLFPERSNQALNAVNVFFGVGSMIGPLLVAAAASAALPTTLAIWPGAVMLLALFPAVHRLARPTADGHERRNVPARLLLMSGLGLMMFLYVGIEVALGGWITWLLTEQGGRTAAGAAAGSSLFWLGLTVGRMLGALLGGRLSPRPMLLLVLLLLAAGLSWLWFGLVSGGALLPAVMLLGIACGPVFPSVMALIGVAGHGSSSGISVAMTIGSGGGLFLPALVGVLLVDYGLPAGMPLLLAAVAVMAVLLLLVSRAMQPAPLIVAPGV